MQDPVVTSEDTENTLVDSQCFENGVVDVKVIDGGLWFCAKDVAKAIEYKGNLNHWERWLDEEDRLKAQNGRTGQARNMTYISESALYRVLIKTDVPKAKPFERWVTKVVIPSVRKTGRYVAPSAPTTPPQELELKRKELETKSKELELERARFLRSVSLSYAGKSDTYRQVLDAYAVHEVVGTFALPLPEVRQRLMSATEVGKVLGISANKVGSIATRNNLKTEENGLWVRDKSRYSSKEVDTFRYNEHGLERLRQLLEQSKEEESND